MFDPVAAENLRANYELRLGEDVFRAMVADCRFVIARGSAERPDAIIEADAATLAALIYENRQLTEAMRSGDIQIEGDVSAVARFLNLFPLPEPATPAIVV
jgi:ubiquinone biosynthesis protein UbiJ